MMCTISQWMKISIKCLLPFCKMGLFNDLKHCAKSRILVSLVQLLTHFYGLWLRAGYTTCLRWEETFYSYLKGVSYENVHFV